MRSVCPGDMVQPGRARGHDLVVEDRFGKSGEVKIARHGYPSFAQRRK
jgi:hypothetical protein